MDLDPHTLHQILEKIRQQLACPQCAQRIEAEHDAMQLCGENFVVFQMQCPHCEAHIVLHATVAGIQVLAHSEQKMNLPDVVPSNNVSTNLHADSQQIAELRKAIEQADGSFTEMFKESK